MCVRLTFISNMLNKICVYEYTWYNEVISHKRSVRSTSTCMLKDL